MQVTGAACWTTRRTAQITEKKGRCGESMGQGRPLLRKKSAALTEYEGEEQPDEEDALP